MNISEAKKNAPERQEYVKDIVQPKNRGVERGAIQTIMTLHAVANVFLIHLKG